MKYGLKVWASNRNYLQPIGDLLKKKACDYVELYVNTGTEEDLLKAWKALPVEYQLHVPHSFSGFNLSFAENLPENLRRMEAVQAYAERLNPRYIIFHPGINGSLDETIRQFGILRDRFPGVLERALIENKPRVGINDEYCLGASVEEIRQLCQAAGLGFCLDVGHAIHYAHSAGVDWKRTLVEFLALNPRVFHLSDGDQNADHDSHEHFGRGNFDFKSILALLPSEGYLAVETKHDSTEHLNDFEEDVRYVQKILKDLQAEADAPPQVRLRPAVSEDCGLLFQWANEFQTRQNSFHPEFIGWEEHRKWFKRILQGAEARIFIAESKQGRPVGYVRLNKKEGEWLISIAVDHLFRGRGWGREILRQGMEFMRRDSEEIKEIIGLVKKENTVSQKLFESLGFSRREKDGCYRYSKKLYEESLH